MSLDIIIGLAGLFGGWNAFIERRIYMLRLELKEKIEDKEKVNQAIQAGLEKQICRLEAKIDTLINIQLQKGDDHE